MDLFDTRNVVEVHDPEQPGLRYCLCKNPATEAKEHGTRRALLERTRAGLDKIARAPGRTTAGKIGARVDRLLARTKMGKFVEWRVEAGRLTWSFNEEKIAAEEVFDGCYIVRSDVPGEQMGAAEVVASYKKLMMVERLAPTLKKHDSDPQTRWSVEYVIGRLKSIRQERREKDGVQWLEITEPDAEQREMLAALGVKL